MIRNFHSITYLRISLSLTIFLISATKASLTHTKRRVSHELRLRQKMTCSLSE